MKLSLSNTSTARLLILLVYCTAAAIVIQFFSYHLPTKLSLVVKGPVPNIYILDCDFGQGFWKEPQTYCVTKGDDFKTVEFYLPDREVKNIRICLDYNPGIANTPENKTHDITIKELRLSGLVKDYWWPPRDIAKVFEPLGNMAYSATIPGKGLLLSVGDGFSLTLPQPYFKDVFASVSQPRWLLYVLFLGFPALLCLIVPNNYRFASYLSFMFALLAYVGLFKGVNDITLPFFGGLFALAVVELMLTRKEFVIVLTSVFLMLFLAELSFLAYESVQRPVPGKTYIYKYPGWPMPDADLDIRSVPNFVEVASAKVGDSFTFKDVVYRSDNKGRRYAPLAGHAGKHALFFGCSFTWGQGLQDDQTMPYYFQKLSGGQYQSYNYGFEGYGAAQMYLLLQDGSLFDDIKQKDGIAVYDFIGEHVFRTAPELQEIRKNAPVFRLDKAGELDGPFKIYEKDDLNLWLRLFGDTNGLVPKTSPFLRYFFKRFPFGPVSRHEMVEATAKVVIESKRLYDSRFKGDFYVVIYDKNDMTDDEIGLFASMLTADGIHVMAVPRMPDPADEDIHPLDKHPSAQRQSWVAERLLKEIKDHTPQKDVVLTR